MHHACRSFSFARLSALVPSLFLLGAAVLPLRAQDVYYGAGQTATGTITNNSPDFLVFQSDASAGSASITNYSSLYFQDNSSAASAVITNTSGGSIVFNSSSSAGFASVTNNGEVYFFGTSTADNASFDSSALIDLSFHTGGLSLGSLAGSGGIFYLGTNAQTVGGLNTSTTYSGVIADGGSNAGTGGSLIKTGTGTLTLTATSTYTGTTTIEGGTLLLAGFDTLGGHGAVIVNSGGTLKGNDFVFGSVTVNSGGHLAADRDNDLQFASGLTLHDGAQLDFTIGENPNTFFSVTGGDFTADGVVTINITQNGGFGSDGVYTLLDFSGASNIYLSGGSFVLGSAVAGYVLGVNGNVVQLTAIPEPSIYAAIFGLGALGLALVRRRRLAA